MALELNALEQRVIGCLIEKQISTPDQYPLSLNALVNACNQRSNRDPVLDLDERAVQAVVDGLARRQLLLEKSGFGSRVPKYQQLFCNTQFGSLKFTPQETAIVCELLVRGPQTPGELRSRAARLAPLKDVSEVEAALEALANRIEGACVERLPREPGRRESRYRHLFGDSTLDRIDHPPLRAAAQPSGMTTGEPGGDDSARGQPAVDASLLARVEALEAAVAALQQQLQALDRRE
jgi:uncharacterized protein YceH (UPF0502 family)